MEKGRMYERIPQEPAEEILKRVLEFRNSYDQYEKPEDVNTLLSLFPRVSLEKGYILDYILEPSGEAVQQILPYIRPSGEDEMLLVMPGENKDSVETLYKYLDYERSPQGLFEYAFFITELWSTRVSWHAAEWLASTPVFTQDRFDELVDRAPKVDSLLRPEWYGPEAELTEGEVRFLVYTEMGWTRIYYLQIAVDAQGCTEQKVGSIVADFGQGLIF